MVTALTPNEVVVLKAVADKRVTATRDGYALDGGPVEQVMAELLGQWLILGLVDVDLDGLDEVQPVEITPRGAWHLPPRRLEFRQ